MSERAITVRSLDDYRALLRLHLADVQRRYGVRALGVFGSYTRGDQRSDSDLDLLVEFDYPGPTLFGFVALENELSDLLGVKVDLVEKSGLKPEVRHRILREVAPV